MSHLFYRPELQAISSLQRESKRRQSICRGYAQYEQRKAQWIASNPNANYAEYECAMQRIARECGV